ncbi:class II fructose-bisphosphate aldolase [Bifidobacterium pullorum subsp. saeculare]|uniref:Fructose-bisphosphate aldolase n=1 Tax=Bifidobacterium pullorum subsp. saeculare TaxID=78257 RepID=A0A939BAW2_9BIFI|nr:class II fructose-bisphosphate aldolase [Bifidobacterium pullorum]MBM6700296.1 class II fructose-bisphosphate aldolase [Bifidobacterium pullorum subsp. saeculare]
MTIATPERYAEMLDAARRGGYAYPAINVTSTQTLNAALQGFAEAESDGIIQVSVGGSAYFSGQAVNDRVVGSLAFAAFAHEVAARYPGITVALHTDHCAKQYLDSWVRPLLDHEIEQVKRGEEPTFQSHMWDGSTVPLEENLDIAAELLDKSVRAHTVLEIEIGAVGGEEDGHSAAIDERLYSTPADGLRVAERLGLGEHGRYMAAFTFGNVHGSYKPGVVKLRPDLLGRIQSEVWQALCDGRLTEASCVSTCTLPDMVEGKPFALVFHGGSGSTPEEIAQAVSHGVVKMNIDTDTQYAFTRAIAGHMFKHYDSVLKVDGEVGEKKFYDPRSWGKKAEKAMAARVVEACQQLGSAGKALK